MSPLVVDFAGSIIELKPGDQLGFGREADLSIDPDNPYLHRRVGMLTSVDGGWWVANTGSAIVLDVCDLSGTSRMSVAPGAVVPVAFVSAVIRFQAGRRTYELGLNQPGQERLHIEFDQFKGEKTITTSSVRLNPEQRLLLAGLARHRLANPAARRSQLATNKEVADSLGWTTVKFNRKLDYLCERFASLGVPGLVGQQGSFAGDRRERLIDHVLTVGLIDSTDLQAYFEKVQT